jgi:hypothetical protein
MYQMYTYCRTAETTEKRNPFAGSVLAAPGGALMRTGTHRANWRAAVTDPLLEFRR